MDASILRKAKEVVKNKGELDFKTLLCIASQNDISIEQAKELWSKSLKFNDILQTKYGDKYLQSINEITKLTKQYQRNVVKQMKTENKK